MDSSTPPSLPELNRDDSLGLGEGYSELEGLSRVSTDDGNGAMEQEPAEQALILREDWFERLQAVTNDNEAVRQTIARFTFAGSAVDMDELAEAIRAAHGTDVLIHVDSSALVMNLPEGVSWSQVAATAAAHGPDAKAIVGLADFGIDDQTLDDALRLSVAAVAMAEEAGTDVVARTLADESAGERENSIAASLVASLEAGTGLRLVFQPKFDVATRTMVGAEALLRHECENLGEIGPAEFLPVAERAGIRASVERWVLDAGMKAIGEWQAAGKLAFPVSLNVAAEEAFDGEFANEMSARLERYGVDPGFVRLEISEAGVVGDIAVAIERLAAIRELGISVALDDFGESDTEITELRKLPIDVLKVHRSFVLEMGRSPSMSALVRGILSLAKVLGIETVAAGVESEEQMSQLQEFGCDVVQGFMLSAPLERSAFEARLSE